MRGRETRLGGKGSAHGRALWAPSHHPSPPWAPAPALPRTCAGLPPSPGGSRRAALGDQRTRRSRAQGTGGGEFPPTPAWACSPPSPPPCGGASLGEFHRPGWPRGAWAGGPRGRTGRGGGGRLRSEAQLPSSPDTSCPCLSRTEHPPLPPASRLRGQGMTRPLPGQRRRDIGKQGRKDPKVGVRVSV